MDASGKFYSCLSLNRYFKIPLSALFIHIFLISSLQGQSAGGLLKNDRIDGYVWGGGGD